jgi:DNA-binding SARP family transcriptional activator/TolB-like protein/Flp pilus assembly protein TadD
VNVAERIQQGAAKSRVVVRCLGRFRLQDAAGDQLQIRTRKARALLAALAFPGRPMSRDSLAALLWSDRGEVQARASLRQTIFELQHFGGEDPILAVGRDEISIRPEHVTTDIDLIRKAVAEGDWPRLLGLLADSDGGLLIDLDGLDCEFDDWLRQQRAQEPAKTLAGAVDAAERCASEAGPRAALDLVAEILRLDPLNEEARRLAMRLAHELGDRVSLHRHFATLRDGLRDEFDAEPSPETMALFAALSNGHAKPPDSPVAEGGRARPQAVSVRWPVLVAPLLVLIRAAGLLFTLVLRDRAPAVAAGRTIVAILPFEEQPRGDSFIAEGVWEQTRAALTRNPAIRVLGRTTTEVMAEQELPPAQYLKRFGVTHLLEGSVRRNGADLLVSVSLSRTNDGVAVWQDMFRGRIGKPFAIQDAIANGIEGKLRARLAPGGGRRAEQIATTPEVYALYSEARQLISSRESSNFRRAEALLRQAVKADPNYAPALSLLGAAIYFNGRLAIVDAKARAEGMAATKRALSMAPNFAPAYATLALIEGEGSPLAEAQLRRAVALDPSYSEAWNWLANSLAYQSRYREAQRAYERALEIDPLLQPAIFNLQSIAGDIGDEAAMDRLLARVTKAGVSPDLITGLRADRARRRGDYSESLKLLSKNGLDRQGHPRGLLWTTWFESLTASGHYDVMHRVTGCPEWYAPLVRGEALPPSTFEGRPITPEEFWTSIFFSTPATRAMIELGHSRDVVRLYRAGFRNADDFLSQTESRNALPELSVNLASALEMQGFDEEASYLLDQASRRVERALKLMPNNRLASGRLAMIRSAQGDRAGAVSQLEAALNTGWFPDGRSIALDLAREPAFRELRGDPRFEAARKRILEHVAKERAELGPLKV